MFYGLLDRIVIYDKASVRENQLGMLLSVYSKYLLMRFSKSSSKILCTKSLLCSEFYNKAK